MRMWFDMTNLALVWMIVDWRHFCVSGTVSDTLFREVWASYRPEVRPMCGDSPFTVPCTLGVAVRQLIDLDEPHQLMHTNLWLRLRWQDCRLTWNKSDYAGVDRITLNRDLVWYPDMTLYDNARDELAELDDYRINVYSTGLVTSLIPVVLTSTCSLDVSKFPFDRQSCNLTFGSWTYTGSEFNLTSTQEDIDISQFIENAEWRLDNITLVLSASPDFKGEFYPQVVFVVQLSRKPLFFVINLLMPSFVIMAISVTGFMLPPHSGEKVNLEITVLLALSVFQLVILRTMPAASENMPAIAIYYIMAMVCVGLSILCTIIVTDLHLNHHHRKLPGCLKRLFTGRFGRCLCMPDVVRILARDLSSKEINPDSITEDQSNSPAHNVGQIRLEPSRRHFNYTTSRTFSGLDRANGDIFLGLDPDVLTSGIPLECLHRTQCGENSSDCCCALLETARSILACMEKMDKRKLAKAKKEALFLEWKMFALLLDRFLLYVFLFVHFAMLVSIVVYISVD